MLLNRSEVDNLKLLRNFSAARWRTVGYDLSVGKMYIPRDDESNSGNCYVEGTTYEIPPQGIVLLFSDEKVAMPKNACAYAMPKTSLCEEGLLVLNTGIIDPGYSGRISGTTINFGKKPYKISRGDAFLRLTFHSLNPQEHQGETSSAAEPNDDLYYAQRVISANNYPATFLNIPDTVKAITDKATKDLLDKERAFFLRTLTTIGGILAVLALLDRWIAPSIDNYVESIGTEQRVEQLERELQQFKKSKQDEKVLTPSSGS